MAKKVYSGDVDEKNIVLIGCFAQAYCSTQFEGDIDIARKTKEAEIVFVADAVKFFKKHSLAESMNAFRYDEKCVVAICASQSLRKMEFFWLMVKNYRFKLDDYLDEKNLADLSL